MKKLLWLFLLLIGMFLLLLVRQENEIKKQEMSLKNARETALESYKSLDSIAVSNMLVGEYYVENKKTMDAYLFSFYRIKEGIYFSLLEFHNNGTFVKPRMEVSFASTPETNWDNLVIVSTSPNYFYNKKYEIRDREFAPDISGAEETILWERCNHHFQVIINAKNDTNFIFKRKDPPPPPPYYFDMDEDFIFPMNPDD